MLEKFNPVAARAAVLGAATSMFVGLAVVLGGGANAQGADPGLAAIEGFESKVTAYGTAMIGVVVVSVLIMLGVKYIRKASNKA